MRVQWNTKAEKLVEKIGPVAVSEAAQMVAEAIRSKTPVADEAYSRNRKPQEPGTLRRSIQVYESKFKKPGWASYVVTAGGQGPWGDAFYARFVEMGTRKMRGHKFMRKGLRAARSRALRVLQKQIRGGL